MPEALKILTLFTVPVIMRTIPDTASLNAELRRIVLAREVSEPGVTQSNADGWHSKQTLLAWPEPEIQVVRKWIDEAARDISRLAIRGDTSKAVDIQYEAQGWANVNRHGHYNAGHTHPNTHWSVVYYVSMGEPEPDRRMNGVLEFPDPRPRATEFPLFDFAKSWRIHPEPGMLVIFPAWLEHMVHPFFGKGERISLAFNLRFNKFEVRVKQSAPAPDAGT